MDETADVRHVSDTALWMAVYRARESERPDAAFRDPLARLLPGERGERIAAAQPFMEQNEWSFIARTWVIDKFVQKEVAAAADAVLNLAAGLDTRPYRLALPATLRWIEVDLPDLIAYKEERLASAKPVCSLERVALDLLDLDQRRRLLDRINEECERVVVITEGLLVFLTREENESLRADLSARPAFSRWILDLSSPGLLRMIQENTAQILEAAPLKFAPAEGLGFWEDHGWRRLDVVALPDAANEINRAPEFLKPALGMPMPDPPGEAVWGGVCLLARK